MQESALYRLVPVAKTLTILFMGCVTSGCQEGGQDHVNDLGRWGRVAVVEDLTIGALDGEDEYLFGRIGYVAVGPEGSIYTADAQLMVVRKYDADGTFVRTIGAKGQGPGEYLRISGLRALRGGTLAVLDTPHRIILYRPDGEYLRDFRVPSQYHGPRMLEFDVAGNLYVRATEHDGPIGTGEWPMVLIKMSPDGEVLDRISLPRKDESGESFVLLTSDGPQWYPTTRTCHAWSPLGYLVVGRNDDYSFELLRPDDGRLRVKRQVDRVPVLPEERAQWQAWIDFFESRGSSGDYSELPEVKPVYRDLSVGDDGSIWVHRHVVAENRDLPPRAPGDGRPLFSWREPTTYDVFDADGVFLGTVVIPPNTIVHVMRGRQLWGVRTGDEGEQIIRLRVDAVSGSG